MRLWQPRRPGCRKADVIGLLLLPKADVGLRYHGSRHWQPTFFTSCDSWTLMIDFAVLVCLYNVLILVVRERSIMMIWAVLVGTWQANRLFDCMPVLLRLGELELFSSELNPGPSLRTISVYMISLSSSSC